MKRGIKRGKKVHAGVTFWESFDDPNRAIIFASLAGFRYITRAQAKRLIPALRAFIRRKPRKLDKKGSR